MATQHQAQIRTALISLLEEQEADQADMAVVAEEVAARVGIAESEAERIIREVADIELVPSGTDLVSVPERLADPDHEERVANILDTNTAELAMEPGAPTGDRYEHLTIREDVGHPLVPRLDHEYYERRLSGTDRSDVAVVSKALADGDFWVNLVGHAGVGKNVLIRHLAEETNTPIVRFGASDDITYEDFTGAYAPKEDASGFEFRYGVGAAAVKFGWWLVVDEVNAAPPEIMTALHQVTEENGNAELLIRETQEVINPHENFRLIGTMNPNYAGTKELNKAFASRAYHVRLDYLPPRIERSILEEKTGLEGREIHRLTMFAKGVRSRLKAGDIRTPVTTRHLIQIGRMAEIMDLHGATKTLLLPYANFNDRDVIDSVIDKYLKDR